MNLPNFFVALRLFSHRLFFAHSIFMRRFARSFSLSLSFSASLSLLVILLFPFCRSVMARPLFRTLFQTLLSVSVLSPFRLFCAYTSPNLSFSFLFSHFFFVIITYPFFAIFVPLVLPSGAFIYRNKNRARSTDICFCLSATFDDIKWKYTSAEIVSQRGVAL